MMLLLMCNSSLVTSSFRAFHLRDLVEEDEDESVVLTN